MGMIARKKKEFLIELGFDIASFIVGFIVACVAFQMTSYWSLALVPVLLFWKRKNVSLKKDIEY